MSVLPPPRLRRVRWAVRATLLLGVAASVTANILHAQPNPVAQTIAAWPPVALLLTVELISRVPVGQRGLAAVRLLATTTIAGIAAWVSYWHIAGVAARYGERGTSPYLLPLSVDGLVIVACVSLVELGGRIRATVPVPTAVPSSGLMSPGVGPAGPVSPSPAKTAPRTAVPGPASAPRPAPPTVGPPPPRAAAGGTPADTAAAVVYWRAKDPTMPVREIGVKVGRSERTVRRILDRHPDHTPAGGGVPVARPAAMSSTGAAHANSDVNDADVGEVAAAGG